MSSLFPFSRVSAGDVVFFRCLSKEESNDFESAVVNVSTVGLDVFHVAMIVDEERIVHATTNKGVCVQTLASVIEEDKPYAVEACQIDTFPDRKQKALEFALNEVDRKSEYNDLFAWDRINSKGNRAYYCCQLIVFSYNLAYPHDQRLFLDHELNFKDKSGEIPPFWHNYFKERGNREVPQGERGSHPSKLRASPCCTCKAIRCIPNTMEKLHIPSDFLKCLHFVGGAFTSLGSSTSSFTVYEPRSGKVLTKINPASKEEVEQVVSLAKEAQKKWYGIPWIERSSILHNVGRLIQSNHELLADWEVRE